VIPDFSADKEIQVRKGQTMFVADKNIVLEILTFPKRFGGKYQKYGTAYQYKSLEGMTLYSVFADPANDDMEETLAAGFITDLLCLKVNGMVTIAGSEWMIANGSREKDVITRADIFAAIGAIYREAAIAKAVAGEVASLLGFDEGFCPICGQRFDAGSHENGCPDIENYERPSFHAILAAFFQAKLQIEYNISKEFIDGWVKTIVDRLS
jgi:hypothetical protein